MIDAYSADPRAKPTILDLPTRQALHRVGYTKLHHSGLSRWRWCPATVLYDTKKEGVSNSVNMLLGSVLHLAFLYADDCRRELLNKEWWLKLFAEAKANDLARNKCPVEYTFEGRRLLLEDVDRFAFQFTNPDALGDVTLGQLVIRTMDQIKSRGFEVVAVEQYLQYVDGRSRSPVVFGGTLDFKVMNSKGAYGIFDTKSYGLWNAYLKGTSPSKQSFQMEEIQYNPQFRHYAGLNRLVYPKQRIQFYGYVTPTNLVPYKKAGNGYKPGDAKGPVVWLAEALEPRYLDDYQHQLVQWCKSIGTGNFYKAMPTNMGDPECPRCPYFKSCQLDSSVGQSTDLIQTLISAPGNEYAYLNTP